MRNALTVDVEDYFQVSAFENSIARSDWDSMPQRAEANTEKVLRLFENCKVRATFFVLGWLAERHPDLVRAIAGAGHEVACHGYSHRRITTMSREEFALDIRKARELLQDISGQPVNGYRAPSYTVTAKTLWALDELIAAGFTYDSSIFPIYHDTYGIPDAQRFPHIITREQGTIREFPPTTLELNLPGKKINLPVAGGGYLRLLPGKWISAAFKKINRENRPCVLYFHPWEIDPDQPRIKKAPLKSRFRHYLNLGTTENKLRLLLSSHSFTTMEETLAEVLPDARP